MRVHLTDIAVRGLKAGSEQYKVWDAAFPGFGVRVNGTSKSWIVMFGVKRQLKVLGHYPPTSLKEARLAASKYLIEVSAPAPQIADPDATVQEAVDRYLAIYSQANHRPSTASEAKRILTSTFVEPHGNSSIRDISKSDISKILDGFRTKPAAAIRTLAVIRGCFAWLADHDYVTANPCDRLKPPTSPVERERVLTGAELGKVLVQGRITPYPFGHIIQLLIILGQRRGETAALQWEWIDEKEMTITFPSSVTKNKREHLIPYGEATAALLRSTPRRNRYVFPALRDQTKDKTATTFAGWGKPKAAFDEAIKGSQTKSPVGPWTLHDLRRTASTMWARLKVPQHINDRLLNHVSGQISGVAAIYNRYEYLDEMRDAVVVWEKRLAELVAPHKTL